MTNPYRYQEPLAGRPGFFNRTSEIMRIGSRIAADRPQSVSIVGELRTGKTSLLNWLGDPVSQTEFMGDSGRHVFLSLRLKENSPENPAAFFAQVDAAWQQQGGGGMTPDYDGFDDRVRGLMQDGKKLVLFLDDFSWVTQNPGFPLGFFSFMRSVANRYDVGYITTSSTDLQKLCHTPGIGESPFFNIFTTVHLEPFKEPDARALVEGQAQEGGVGLDSVTDGILELGGGSPYLLQLVGHLAYEAQTRGEVAPESLAHRAFQEARGYLEPLWEAHFPPVQQEVLRRVDAGQAIERPHEYAADSLARRGHLVNVEGAYRFRSALLARFVQEHGRGGFWRRLLGERR